MDSYLLKKQKKSFLLSYRFSVSGIFIPVTSSWLFNSLCLIDSPYWSWVTVFWLLFSVMIGPLKYLPSGLTVSGESVKTEMWIWVLAYFHQKPCFLWRKLEVFPVFFLIVCFHQNCFEVQMNQTNLLNSFCQFDVKGNCSTHINPWMWMDPDCDSVCPSALNTELQA